VSERTEKGHFKSIFEMAERLESKYINKKSIENLALAGAFDGFKNLHRAMFFTVDGEGQTLTDKVIKYCNQKNNTNDLQASLFMGNDEVMVAEPKISVVEPWTALEQLAREKEVVGFYISGHPLDDYKLVLKHRCNIDCSKLKSGIENYRNKDLFFGGVVTSFENRTSKNGNPFGKLIIEDYHGNIDLAFFGKDYVEFNKYMMKGLFVFVKARVQERYMQPGNWELKILKIDLLQEIKNKAFNQIKLSMKLNDLNQQLVQHLEELINQHKGTSTLEFLIEDDDTKQNLKLFSKKNKISIDQDLIFELEKHSEMKVELVS
jgi:DNA polymerase-3 subunit alpha